MDTTPYTTMFIDAFTKPPVNDGNPNGGYAHAYLGRHAKGKGRRYRRGKHRCLECGFRLASKDGPVDPDRHLAPRERLAKNMFTSSPLLEYLTRQGRVRNG